jgi:hypothetical protein
MHRSRDDLRAELEDRLRFEMLLVELSARFVGVSSQSIDDEIVSAMGQIVEALDLDQGFCPHAFLVQTWTSTVV